VYVCVISSIVCIHCIVTATDGNKVVYEYKKNLPYDVIEKLCNVEVCIFINTISIMETTVSLKIELKYNF